MPWPRIAGMTYSPISGMKTRMLPVIRPGQTIGSVICRKVAQRSGAEVLGRLEQRPVEPLERDVQREHHQRQVVVDDADEDRGRRAQDLDVLRRSGRSRNPATPRGPRIISQAIVRIRKLVQNGMTSRMMSRPLRRAAARRDEVRERERDEQAQRRCPPTRQDRLVTNGSGRFEDDRRSCRA